MISIAMRLANVFLLTKNVAHLNRQSFGKLGNYIRARIMSKAKWKLAIKHNKTVKAQVFGCFHNEIVLDA